MASLNVQNFATMVSNQVAAIQSRATALVDFSVGSVLRSFVEAVAGVSLWLQGLILQLLATTRLATSSGTDVDSFVNDFTVTRLPGQQSSGQVTFGRYTGSTTALVPVGATLQTQDGTQSFTVTLNTAYATYISALNGYQAAANVLTLNVPVQSVNSAAAANVLAGTITVMTSAVPGFDYVSNSAALTNGSDPESDAHLKTRFQQFFPGLAKGNAGGLAWAIDALGVNVFYTTTEYYNYAGQAAPGTYYVVADDGSGSPSSTFLTSVSNAVQSVRPLGIQAAVFAPTITTANVNMILTTATGYTHATVVSAVVALITNNINALELGASLEFGALYSWAYSVAGVTNVTGVTLNSLTGDAASITGTNQAVIRAGVIAVS